MNALEITSEPTWIGETALLAIHAQQIERYGGSHGVLDENVIRSALARPINRWAFDKSTDMADLGASYLVGLARTQEFVDGNKRTGLACALVFFEANGLSVTVPLEELYELTMAVAIGEAGDAEAALLFRAYL